MNSTSIADLIVRREFDAFQDGLRARFLKLGLAYQLTYCDPTDNPAMRLDFESEAHLGRVTLWASGACDLEVIDAEGRTVLWEHHEITMDSDFHELFPRVPLLLGELRPSVQTV